MENKRTHKIQDPEFTRIDCTIPVKLKEKLIARSKELGINLKSTLIVILDKELNQ